MTNARAKAKAGYVNNHGSSSPPSAAAQPKSRPASDSSPPRPPPALVICRNKHWRYISSYHGPWLSLPPEVLESLACSNFYSPRPQPIDPAVFFDLVKIRRLIDEATGLAVRAANGTTSAALSSSLNATNGILSGSDVEILGLGSSRGGGGNAKLSRERKHRMREHATQKLAAAYRLDEIAASVAIMQSASALEDVAKLVLQRHETDADAQYVHFFHEKIPSRALAASTTLDALNSIIHQRPTDPATYRTRAITRVFKEDHVGAARDLTDGLAVFKVYHAGHSNEQRDLILARDAAKLVRDNARHEAKVDDKDQPSSLEPQFLFHRGNTYLTLACEHISAALQGQAATASDQTAGITPAETGPSEARARAEARKMVRTCAKRALRDYLAFLGHLDYTPGLPAEHTEAFLQKLSAAQQSQDNRSRSRSERLLDLDAHSQSGLAEALVKYGGGPSNDGPGAQPPPPPPPPHIPKAKVHKLNTLFAAVPPADLPPYPADAGSKQERRDALFNVADFSEAVTYHPLLTEVIHSVLLCHCLIQTSTKEHRRHAYMAARVARVCDGYPIFLAARSPARADWMEILQRPNDFLGLEASWETLCQPPARTPLPTSQTKNRKTDKDTTGVGVAAAAERKRHKEGGKEKEKETEGERKERIKRKAIEGALADERVVDEESFKQSVRAREEALNTTTTTTTTTTATANGTVITSTTATTTTSQKDKKVDGSQSRNSSTEKEKEKEKEREKDKEKKQPNANANANANNIPIISTERAEAIVRWIRDAPLPSGSGSSGGSSSGKGARKKKRTATATAATSRAQSENASVAELEKSVESLDLLD